MNKVTPLKKKSYVRQALHLVARGTKLSTLDALRREAFGSATIGQTLIASKLNFEQCQSEALQAAAANHLTRAGLLAETEWKVTIAFWTVLLASGVALNTVCGGTHTDMALLALRSGGILLLGYFFSCSIFVFGFSTNQSQSIGTERNRFLYYQSAALYAVGIEDKSAHVPLKIVQGKHPLATIDRRQTRLSTVWAMKLVSSTGFVIGAWGSAMYVTWSRSFPKGDQSIDVYATINFIIVCIVLPVWLLMTFFFFYRAHRAAR